MRLRISQNGNLGIPRKFTVCLQPANVDYLRERDEYTYKFRPAKSREDPVLDCIKEAIWKLPGPARIPSHSTCQNLARARPTELQQDPSSPGMQVDPNQGVAHPAGGRANP